MGKLNRIPFGFLDLVQAVTSGQAPSEYSETVGPGIDIGKFYFSQRKDAARAFATVNQGGGVQITVPNDETWLLYSVATNVIFGGGLAEKMIVSVSVRGLISKSTGEDIFPLAVHDHIAPAVGLNNTRHASLLDIGLILQPGEIVSALVLTADVAVSRGLTMFLGFARMQI